MQGFTEGRHKGTKEILHLLGLAHVQTNYLQVVLALEVYYFGLFSHRIAVSYQVLDVLFMIGEI